MSRSFVVGIADNSADAAQISTALRDAGIDLARLALVTAGETPLSTLAEPLGMRLFQAGTGRDEDNIVAESSGPQVPDVTNAGLVGLDHGYSAEDALVDAGVPESLSETLAEMVDAGKAVFVFHTADPADAARVAQRFKSAGLHAVRAHEG